MGRWWERLGKKQAHMADQETSLAADIVHEQNDRKIDDTAQVMQVMDDSSANPELFAKAIHQDEENLEKERMSESLEPAVYEEEYRMAVAECNRAMVEWKNALHKLDWVVEPDQIDYAIYSVIAAEKHYSTLLKETKRMHQRLSKVKNA